MIDNNATTSTCFYLSIDTFIGIDWYCSLKIVGLFLYLFFFIKKDYHFELTLTEKYKSFYPLHKDCSDCTIKNEFRAV